MVAAKFSPSKLSSRNPPPLYARGERISTTPPLLPPHPAPPTTTALLQAPPKKKKKLPSADAEKVHHHHSPHHYAPHHCIPMLASTIITRPIGRWSVTWGGRGSTEPSQNWGARGVWGKSSVDGGPCFHWRPKRRTRWPTAKCP